MHMMCSNLTESQVTFLPSSSEPPPHPQGSCTALSLATSDCLPLAASARRIGKADEKARDMRGAHQAGQDLLGLSLFYKADFNCSFLMRSEVSSCIPLAEMPELLWVAITNCGYIKPGPLALILLQSCLHLQPLNEMKQAKSHICT